MEPSRNSTDVTKPPTRARTWTSWTASKRPVNSSQPVTVRFTGCAPVTGGRAADGGGDLDLLARLEAPGELIPVGHGPLHRLRHGNRRRCRSRLLRRLVAA